MKVQQRPFVIEYKSGRRRVPTEPLSIWGNANLKAIAKDVEDDAPHLFTAASELSHEGRGSVQEKEAAVTDDDQVVDALPKPDCHSATLVVDQEVAVQASASLEAAAETIASAPQPVGSETAVSPVKDYAKQLKTRARRTLDVSVPPSVLNHGDLGMLEDENRRLKILLSDELREQNTWLRMMLARFDCAVTQ